MLDKENKQPLVSICIPVYNGEKYILEAVTSALNQDYENIEVLACDNISTDQTLEILNEIEDVNLTVIEANVHVGMAANWNRAISYAKGDLVLMLSADDMLTPPAVDEMVRGMLLNHTDIAFGNAQYLVENQNKEYTSTIQQNVVDTVITELESYVVDQAFSVNINSLLAPRDLMHFDEEVGLVCDLDLLIKLGKKSLTAFRNPNDTVLYRVHDDNLSSNKEKMWAQSLEVYATHLKESDQISMYKDRVFKTLMWLVVYLLDQSKKQSARKYQDTYLPLLSIKQQMMIKSLWILPVRAVLRKMRANRAN